MPDYLLIDTGEYLLLEDGSPDRLLLEPEVSGSGGGAGPSRRQRQRAAIARDDEEVMRFVEEFLSKQ